MSMTTKIVSSVASKKPTAVSITTKKKAAAACKFLAPPTGPTVHPRRRPTSGTTVEVRTRRTLGSNKWLVLSLPARVLAVSGGYCSFKYAGGLSSSTSCVVRVPAEHIREARSACAATATTCSASDWPMKRPLRSPEPPGQCKRLKTM